jgi:hypothetical protein
MMKKKKIPFLLNLLVFYYYYYYFILFDFSKVPRGYCLKSAERIKFPFEYLKFFS